MKAEVAGQLHWTSIFKLDVNLASAARSVRHQLDDDPRAADGSECVEFVVVNWRGVRSCSSATKQLQVLLRRAGTKSCRIGSRRCFRGGVPWRQPGVLF